VIDILESYYDEFSASMRPNLLPTTQVNRAMEHIAIMDDVLYAWFPEVLVTHVFLLSF